MFQTAKQIVRIALLMMLFQFLAPAFVPLVVQEIPTDRAIAYSVQHSSIVVPMLLKEKDEKEDNEFTSVSNSAPLLDLTRHSSNLTASHEAKYSISTDKYGFPQPPLSTLYCTFLI